MNQWQWRPNETHCKMLNTLQFGWFANEKSERRNGPSAAECVIVYGRFIICRCEIKKIIIQLDFLKKIWVVVWSQMANYPLKLLEITTILQLACRELQWKMFDRVYTTAMSCTHNGLGKIITRKNGRKRAVFYRIARKPQNWINSLLDRDLILLAICTISTRNGLERRLKLWSNSLRNLGWFPLYLRSHFFFFFQYEVSHMSCIGRMRGRERNERQLADSACESTSSYPEETQAGTCHWTDFEVFLKDM